MDSPLPLNKIKFHSLEKPIWLKNRTILKKFILSIFRREKKTLTDLAVVFCSDEYLFEMNSKYLKHDTYTDIITFDLSHANAGTSAEIYISLDRIRENATIYGNSAAKELRRVIFHGILHLCGYKDKTYHQKEVMRSKEDYYLNRYNAFVLRKVVPRET